MELRPAIFNCDYSKVIHQSDENYDIVDGLMRGFFEVFFDRSGSPERAIITIDEETMREVKDALAKGEYDGEDPGLLNVIKALVAYANAYPSHEGMYCFVSDDF